MANYSLPNGFLYEINGVINLNKIKNWKEMKKLLRWVNVQFQQWINNRQSKSFTCIFKTKDKEDVLNFSLKLIDEKNEEMKLKDEKNNSKLRFYH